MIGFAAFSNPSSQANDSTTLELPKPGWILFGNDEGGIPGLGVFGAATNNEVRATFIGKEWPLPG